MSNIRALRVKCNERKVHFDNLPSGPTHIIMMKYSKMNALSIDVNTGVQFLLRRKINQKRENPVIFPECTPRFQLACSLLLLRYFGKSNRNGKSDAIVNVSRITIRNEIIRMITVITWHITTPYSTYLSSRLHKITLEILSSPHTWNR